MCDECDRLANYYQLVTRMYTDSVATIWPVLGTPGSLHSHPICELLQKERRAARAAIYLHENQIHRPLLPRAGSLSAEVARI
jgi:hypothetical protein